MSTKIRPIEPDEAEPFFAAAASAFGNAADPDYVEQTRAIAEFDRSLATFDGEEIVGTTGIFSLDLTVPGAKLATAGVTWVSVKPTHRRSGVLTNMMRRQLDDIRERGEALAALWASESIIYGRFGYGLAAEGAELRIERTRTAFTHEQAACGKTRLVSREDALGSWPAVYDRVLASQPGMFARSQTWWQHKVLRESSGGQSGPSGRFFVQYEEDGHPLGYARYRVTPGRDSSSPDGTLSVRELMATTESAYAALWSYLFGVDLVGSIEARLRPIDEPLLWMLADPRRLTRHPSDTLWVRIVDVASALEGRRYAAEGRVVLDVRDQFCPWNEGRYELEGGPHGARCLRSDAEPEIVLDASDLGAAYLGGVRLQTLHRAGRVQGDADALRRADAMLAWSPLPWCPEVF